MKRAALTVLIILLAASWPPSPATVEAAPVHQVANPCQVAINAAISKIGNRYVWGAKGPNTFDCSGLTYWAYLQAGINIGVSTYDQQFAGLRTNCTMANFDGVNTTCWAPGDLVFLKYPTGQHVSLYVGQGIVVDAYNENKGVIYHNPKNDPFYVANFWQGRRIATGCAGAGVAEEITGPSIIDPGMTPAIEAIANILPPIELLLPYSCGNCIGGQQPLTRLQYPAPSFSPIYPFQWLGVWMYNELFYPLICWLLTIAQGLLNGIATAFNAVLVNGVNLFWRLGILALLWFKEVSLAFWSAIGDMRLMLYELAAGGLVGLGELGAILGELAELARLALVELGRLLISAAQGLGYLLGLFMAIIPGLVVAVFNPTEPPQLAQVESFFLFQWFIDIPRAIADSSLGWVWVAFVGVIYLKFVFWLLDELKELNS